MDSVTGIIYFRHLGVDRHHLILHNTHSIFPSSWSHALWMTFHWSKQFGWFLTLLQSVHQFTQCVWFSMAGYSYVASHPSPLFGKPVLLSPKNYNAMPRKVQWSIDDLLSAFNLYRVITEWLIGLRDTLWGHDEVGMQIHLEVVIECVGRYTWRQWWTEDGDALEGRIWASLEVHLEAVIMWTCSPWTCTGGDTHRGHDWVNRVIHSEGMIKQV